MSEHNHAHHAHDENGNCILEGNDPHGAAEDEGAVMTELHLHDEARVISGRLTVAGSYDAVRKALSENLEQTARAVQEQGGIVGHIKASCEVKTVEMFSVTDTVVSVKKAPEQEIHINLAAIVFLIEPDKAEQLVHEALHAVKDIAGK